MEDAEAAIEAARTAQRVGIFHRANDLRPCRADHEHFPRGGFWAGAEHHAVRNSRARIDLANQSTYGLANSVWSSDVPIRMTISRQLRSSLVWANTPFEAAPHAVRRREIERLWPRDGREGFNEFTVLKILVIKSDKRADIYSV
jgi:Aldehyde dehydrogenase family